MIQTEHTIHFATGNRGARHARTGEKKPAATGRVPRVTRLMALAIRLDQLIREGHVADQAEMARLGYITRGRLTQIMNLLFLAPDIQEELLFLPLTHEGRDPVYEQHLRPISAVRCWSKQRELWRQLKR